MHRIFVSVGLPALVAFTAFAAEPAKAQPALERKSSARTPPLLLRGVTGVRLRIGRDALIDLDTWRTWNSDRGSVRLTIRNGRFDIAAAGQIGHNGIWQRGGLRYKDVVLVCRMDSDARCSIL